MKLVRFSNYFTVPLPVRVFIKTDSPGLRANPAEKPRGQRVELFSNKKKQSKGGLAPAGRGRPISIFEIDDALLPYPVWAVRARLYKSFYKYMQS